MIDIDIRPCAEGTVSAISQSPATIGRVGIASYCDVSGRARVSCRCQQQLSVCREVCGSVR